MKRRLIILIAVGYLLTYAYMALYKAPEKVERKEMSTAVFFNIYIPEFENNLLASSLLAVEMRKKDNEFIMKGIRYTQYENGKATKVMTADNGICRFDNTGKLLFFKASGNLEVK